MNSIIKSTIESLTKPFAQDIELEEHKGPNLDCEKTFFCPKFIHAFEAASLWITNVCTSLGPNLNNLPAPKKISFQSNTKDKYNPIKLSA